MREATVSDPSLSPLKMFPSQFANHLFSLDFHFQDWTGVLYSLLAGFPAALALLRLPDFSPALLVGILGLQSQWLLFRQTFEACCIIDVR